MHGFWTFARQELATRSPDGTEGNNTQPLDERETSLLVAERQIVTRVAVVQVTFSMMVDRICCLINQMRPLGKENRLLWKAWRGLGVVSSPSGQPKYNELDKLAPIHPD